MQVLWIVKIAEIAIMNTVYSYDFISQPSSFCFRVCVSLVAHYICYMIARAVVSNDLTNLKIFP